MQLRSLVPPAQRRHRRSTRRKTPAGTVEEQTPALAGTELELAAAASASGRLAAARSPLGAGGTSGLASL
eukprot:8165530-Alexandrium_andersonii.AAC.1